MTDRKKLVALTGAGISAESGIPTFRNSGGMWEQYDVKKLASIEGWRRNPELVQRFYNERRKQLGNVEPNTAHRILAELEKDFDVTVITQNVDNLHERAGSTKVIHLHGELTKARSSKHPNMVFDIGYRPIEQGEKAPDGSLLRPHIVWFGEQVPMIEAAQATVAAADIFVIIGSGLTVFPAAELIKYAKANTPIYFINPKEINYIDRHITVIREKATAGMEKLKTVLSQIQNEPQNEMEDITNIYNVIILDQSGSMERIRDVAIDGFNETFQTIKAAQLQYADKQEHFVTLVVFNSAEIKTVYDRISCTKVKELTREKYIPDCSTPLYDAMGRTLSKFRNSLDTSKNNDVLVTIITDGLENASKEYSGRQIKEMVNELKTQGWVFTYIGANHDVESAAENVGISNSLKFDSTRRGTKEMFEKEMKSRSRYYNMIVSKLSLEDGDYFKEDEEVEKTN